MSQEQFEGRLAFFLVLIFLYTLRFTHLGRIWWYPLKDWGGIEPEIPLDFEGVPVHRAEFVVAVQDGAVRRPILHRVRHPKIVDFQRR